MSEEPRDEGMDEDINLDSSSKKGEEHCCETIIDYHKCCHKSFTNLRQLDRMEATSPRALHPAPTIRCVQGNDPIHILSSPTGIYLLSHQHLEQYQLLSLFFNFTTSSYRALICSSREQLCSRICSCTAYIFW